MDFKMHEYTHAIVGKAAPVLRMTDKVDLNDARRQQDCFLRLLRELNIEVIEVDLGGTFPANVLVEDTAVVCHGIGLMTKPINKTEETKVRIFF